jgi:hypothetical protein
MELSDHDKCDLIGYIESGKPLPAKYRFMLFDDAREVELLWNGKTNEVTNVVLPFQTIDGQGRQQYRQFQVLQLALVSVELMRSVWRMPPYQRGRWSQGKRHTFQAQSSSELTLPQCGITPAHPGCTRSKSHHGGQRQDASLRRLRTKAFTICGHTMV